MRENQCMTVREMAAEIGIGHRVDQEMMESLGSCWIPHLLTGEHRLQPKKKSFLTLAGTVWY
jgi:hypothetical protein